jgi:WhiB family redox-sensing transcriptional regulator
MHADVSWQDNAKCLDEKPELFFPVGDSDKALRQTKRAQSICKSCKVAVRCLEYSVKESLEFGIYGGYTEDERKALKRKYIETRRETK